MVSNPVVSIVSSDNKPTPQDSEKPFKFTTGTFLYSNAEKSLHFRTEIRPKISMNGNSLDLSGVIDSIVYKKVVKDKEERHAHVMEGIFNHSSIKGGGWSKKLQITYFSNSEIDVIFLS